MKSIHRLTFSIDLDGVLCSIVSHTRYSYAKPIELNVNKVRELAKQEHRIIIHTSRLELDRVVTVRWLKKNKVPYTELVMGKPQSDFYIDDRNISVDVWLRTPYPTYNHFQLVPWEQYLNDIDDFCSKLPDNIRYIAGVPRKGLIPATLIALKLRKKMIDLKDTSEEDLIVDDDCKNGITVAELRKKYPAKISAIYSCPDMVDKLDFVLKVVDYKELDSKGVWIVYPWEYNLLNNLDIENIPKDNFCGHIDNYLYEKPTRK